MSMLLASAGVVLVNDLGHAEALGVSSWLATYTQFSSYDAAYLKWYAGEEHATGEVILCTGARTVATSLGPLVYREPRNTPSVGRRWKSLPDGNFNIIFQMLQSLFTRGIVHIPPARGRSGLSTSHDYPVINLTNSIATSWSKTELVDKIGVIKPPLEMIQHYSDISAD